MAIDELNDAASASGMEEVRASIDAIDREILALLGRRMRWIKRAGEIKPVREAVRDEWRKRDVDGKVRAAAAAHDFPPDLASAVYEVLMEGSIAYEFTVFDAR